MLRLMCCISLLFATSAFALDMDFYAYDGFDQVRNGFERIALTFGATSYIGIVFVFIVLGLVFGAYASVGRAFLNIGRGTQMSFGWIFMTLFGTVLFKTLILSTGTMHIYDPVQNRYQPVADVPDLIVLVAGTLNKVERAVVEVIDDNPAEPFADRYGGIGFQLLYNIMEDSNAIDDHYLFKTLQHYYKDCSPIALANPTNPFNVQTLRSGTTDLMATLSDLALPGITTTYFNAANKIGAVDTCQNIWTNQITPALNLPSTFDAPLLTACSKAGFNTNDAAGIVRCREIVDTLSPSLFNVAGNSLHLLRTRALSLALQQAITDTNPDVGITALANQSSMLDGLGTALTANQWLPTVKATLTVIVLGITPILILFLVTPLFAKSLTLLVGLFAFITVWGVTDAIIHVGALDQAYAAAEEIRRHNMGVDAVMIAPEAAQKGMAIFAKARVLGLTITSILAGTLFGVSVYGLASAGGRLEEPIEAKGAEAANKVTTSEGYGGYVDSMSQGYSASVETVGAGSFAQASNARAFDRSESTFGAQQTFDSLSASNGTGLLDSAQIASSVGAGARVGSISATQKATERMGGNEKDSATLLATSARVADVETSQRIGGAEGVLDALDKGTTGSPETSDVLANAAFNSARQLSQSTGQTDIFNDKVEALQYHHQDQTGETLTFPEAAAELARFEQADLEAEMGAFKGNTSEAVQFRETEKLLSIGQQDGFIAVASQLDESPQALMQAQGKLHAAMAAGDQEALGDLDMKDIVLGAAASRIMTTADTSAAREVYGDDNFYYAYKDMSENQNRLRSASSTQVDRVADLLASSSQEAADAIVLANTMFTANQEQLNNLQDTGKLDAAFVASAEDGARFNLGLTADGEIASATADAGTSNYYNDQTTFRTGSNVSSGGSFVLNEEYQDELAKYLQANNDDLQAMQSLKLDAANYLNNLVNSSVSIGQTQSAGVDVSVRPPLDTAIATITGFSAGASYNFSGTSSDNDRVDVGFSVVDDAFDRAASQAHRDTNTWSQESAENGQVQSSEARDNYYFERYAEHVNENLTDTAARYEALREEHVDASEIVQQENKADAKEDRAESGSRPNRRGR